MEGDDYYLDHRFASIVALPILEDGPVIRALKRASRDEQWADALLTVAALATRPAEIEAFILES